MGNYLNHKLDPVKYQEAVRILESNCCCDPEYSNGVTTYCLKGGGSARLTNQRELTTTEIKDDELRKTLKKIIGEDKPN